MPWSGPPWSALELLQNIQYICSYFQLINKSNISRGYFCLILCFRQKLMWKMKFIHTHTEYTEMYLCRNGKNKNGSVYMEKSQD